MRQDPCDHHQMEESILIPDRPSVLRRVIKNGIPAVLLGAIFMLGYYGAQNHKTVAGSPMKLDAASEYSAIREYLMGSEIFDSTERNFRDAEMDFTVSNRYTQDDGQAPGKHLKWGEDAVFAEPHTETYFSFDDHEADRSYEWSVYTFDAGKGLPGTIERKFYGPSFSYTWTSTGYRMIVLSEFKDTPEGDRFLSKMSTRTMYIRYVRREIRSLFQDDREELLDAMKLHWTLSQEEGQELYGENYRSMLTLLQYHLAAAGDKECDHFHDGYGFVSQHAAITILFEQSLQAVNPRLSMPYWDYVRDFEQFAAAGEGYMQFSNGPLFTEEFFGSTGGDNKIQDGRWAGLTVPVVDDLAKEAVSITPHNRYGQLRSPWSNNKDRSAVRSSELCGVDGTESDGAADCPVLESLVGQQTYAEWAQSVSYGPHGPAHVLLGGMLHCAEAWGRLAALGVDDQAVTKLKAWAFSFHKNAWRAGVLDCEVAGVDGCKCKDEYVALWEEDANELDAFLRMVGASNWVRDLTGEQKQGVATALCNSGAVLGDNLQSSSSYMPEFWPIHGNVERMLQLKLTKGDWAEGGTYEGGSWLRGSTQETCYGHGSNDDVLLKRDRIMVGGSKEPLTNTGLLRMLELDSKDLDYIYDNVDFEYCGTDSLIAG